MGAANAFRSETQCAPRTHTLRQKALGLPPRLKSSANTEDRTKSHASAICATPCPEHHQANACVLWGKSPVACYMHAEIIHCMCQDLSDAYAQFLATNHLRMERAPRRAMKLRGRLLLSRTLPQTALRKRLRLATQHVQSALCEPLRRGLSSRSPRRCMLNFWLQATAMLSLFVTICKVMRRSLLRAQTLPQFPKHSFPRVHMLPSGSGHSGD